MAERVGLIKLLPVRSRLSDQLGGATRRAARPEKTDGSARGSWGLGPRKRRSHQGLWRYMPPRCWLPRRSWRLEHNQCHSLYLFPRFLIAARLVSSRGISSQAVVSAIQAQKSRRK